MSDVKRYFVYWNDQIYSENKEGDIVMAVDFDRVTAERDALQLLMNERDEQLHTLELSRRSHFDNGLAAERRVEYLETELRTTKQALNSLKGERADIASKAQCQFPQSCTTLCDCDIPDFSPGNGNKARRRAEALKTNTFSDANEPPCTACFARGCNGECSGDGAMGG